MKRFTMFACDAKDAGLVQIQRRVGCGVDASETVN